MYDDDNLIEQAFFGDTPIKRRSKTPERDVLVSAAERAMERAQRQMDKAQDQIDRLLSLPNEPTSDDPDGALVIWFIHRFNSGSKAYTYAAVKAGDGLWYTTGPASPKGYTWDELMLWHSNEINVNDTMWIATGWEAIQ